MSFRSNRSDRSNTNQGYANRGYGSDRSNQDRSSQNQNQNMDERRRFFAELNRSLVSWVYDSIEMSRYNFRMLKDVSDLSMLLTNRYYMSGNYSGVNCFLVFTKLKGKFYSFIVERKMLSYSIDKMDWDSLRITNINVVVDQAIYNGTIFDGIYFNRGDINKFTITDAYRFKGTDYSVIDLKLKLTELKYYFERLNTQVGRSNPNGQNGQNSQNAQNKRVSIEIDINKIYDVADFDSVINTKLHIDSTMPRGICFYPEKSGTKLIFNYEHRPNILNGAPGLIKAAPDRTSTTPIARSTGSNDPNDPNDPNDSNDSHDSQRSQRSYDSHRTSSTKPDAKTMKTDKADKADKADKIDKSDTDKKRLKLTKTYYTSIQDTSGEIKAVLGMTPTSTPDNYDLYCVERVGTNKLRKQKRDIAYIPDAEKSKWLRSLFSVDPKPKLMNCVWRDDRKKWEPMSVNTMAKLPSLSSKIDEHLVAVEESDSESEFE